MNITFNRDSVTVMLANLAGNTIIRVTTETTPKLKGGKKNLMQGEITKITVSSVQIFTNQNTNGYNNKRLKANADFKLSPRAWGERVAGTPFVTHKGKDYLEVIFNKVIETEYFRNGKSIAKDAIEGLPKSKPASDTDGVIIRTYALESIRSLRAFGNEYTT